jgi:arginyl-tRNA synthetase
MKTDDGWSKGSSRNGKIIKLTDVLDEAIVKEKNLVSGSSDEQAEYLGIGSVVFNCLKYKNKSNIKFDLDEATKLDGATGPFIQYTYARLCSILKKNTVELIDSDYKINEVEKEILLQCLILKESLYKVVENNEPSVLCGNLIDFCKMISKYLTNGDNVEDRVLNDDIHKRSYRLKFVNKLRLILGDCLDLIGLHKIDYIVSKKILPTILIR